MQSITKTITITKLNSSGEGVSLEGGETILVPFTLPGEVVEVSIEAGGSKRAQLEKILLESAERQKPPCPYFGKCGGCQLQHLNSDSYGRYKKELVQESFDAHKLKGVVLDAVLLGPGLRRRINFKATKKEGRVRLGYHQRRSHAVLDIDRCPLLLEDFNSLIPSLKEVFGFCLDAEEVANIFLTKVSNGFDGTIVFDRKEKLSLDQNQRLMEWAKAVGVVRLLVKFGEKEDLVVHQASPQINFSGFSVLFPPHAFLQTSVLAEEKMVQIVQSLLPKKPKKILDLFSGLGTFSFPLSQYGKVDAVEGDFKAVQYLNLSAQQNKLPLRAVQRDLFKYPLSAEELNSYDVVVLDPPRAGAVQQIKSLMASSVHRIIMISCNANTFARDAQLLVKGGYAMKETHLVDQFLWSPHMELISSFEKI